LSRKYYTLFIRFNSFLQNILHFYPFSPKKLHQSIFNFSITFNNSFTLYLYFLYFILSNSYTYSTIYSNFNSPLFLIYYSLNHLPYKTSRSYYFCYFEFSNYWMNFCSICALKKLFFALNKIKNYLLNSHFLSEFKNSFEKIIIKKIFFLSKKTKNFFFWIYLKFL
jgi:hypothetical protein